MTNREKFTQAMDAALRELLRANPSEYRYTEADVPAVVASQVRMLERMEVPPGAAGRAAAKACGVKPLTRENIRRYLKG